MILVEVIKLKIKSNSFYVVLYVYSTDLQGELELAFWKHALQFTEGNQFASPHYFHQNGRLALFFLFLEY